MANLTFNSVEEFKDAMYRACKANDGWTPEEVFQELAARGATIKGFPILGEDEFDFKPEDMNIILSGGEPLGGGNKRNPVEGEAGYDEWKKTHDKDLADKASFQDLTKEEGWGSKTGQEKLKIFADKYNKLLNETKDYVLDNYSGEGLTGEGREEFLKGLYKKQTALKELENSNEFKNLMLDLAEAGTGNPLDNGSLNGKLNETLKLAASGAGSEMFQDKETLNNIVNAARTSGIGKSLDSYIKNGGRASLIGPGAGLIGGLYNMFAGEDAQDIAKEYVNKNGLTRESLMSDEEKENNKWKKLREKNPNVDIKKATDAMLFGDEAANSGIDNYINIRDDKLATLLKVKGAESPEEIDKILSQYPSWQNAKQVWKDETLKRLSEKISNVKYDDFAKQLKDRKAKKEAEKSKEEKKVGDDWAPSNDDSINGVEKDESTIKKVTDFLKGDKKISKEDLYSALPDKAKQLIDGIDKEAKARLNAKEHIWDTDENGYRDPDSPINGTEEDVKSTNEKGGKGTSKKETKQTSKNNKFLYITKEVQKLKPNERIKYLKEHGFSVDKNGYFTKNGMKTLVYKDGQYNPKYVKPDKEEGYNDRTLVEPKQDKFQIALQKSGYQGPRDANGNFLPMTDKYLDIMEAKKNLKDKSKK